MAKQVCEVMAIAGKFTKAQSDEHLRNWSEKKFEAAQKRNHYDPSRTHLNFEIGQGGVVTKVNKGLSIPQRIKEIFMRRGIVDPNEKKRARPDRNKNGRVKRQYITHANIVFGGSRSCMRKFAFGEQEVDYERYASNHMVTRKQEIEEWAKDVYNFAAKKWGEDNIAAFVVHLDELNPHIHCTLLVVNDHNKVSYRDLFGTPKDKRKIRKLHDELAEVNKKWGLERGTSIDVSGATHRSYAEYKRSVDALGKKASWLYDEEIEAAEQTRERIEERETGILSLEKAIRSLSTSAEELRDILDSEEVTIDDIARALRIAGRRVGGLKTMLKNLREKEAELKGRQLDENEKRELDKITRDIQDKEEKLEKAMMQLDILLEKKAELEGRVAEKRQRALDLSSRKVQTNLGFAGTMILPFIAADINNMQKSLGPFNENKGENTNEGETDDGIPYEGFEDHAEDIMDCAVLLFSGMIQSALTKSEVCGGGLGSGALPKKKDDEDEREFARRCLAASARGFVPTAKKGRRR